MWSDRLEYIIENAPYLKIDFPWEDDYLKLDLNSDNEKMRTILSIKSYLKTLPESMKLFFLNTLQKFLEIKYDWDKIPPILLPLTWDEIREMRDSGLVSFGAHTVTHPILSNCTYDQQRNELTLSQQRINKEMGESTSLFAYPNGGLVDYNDKSIELLRELGYLGAVTTIAGYVNHHNHDNFQLNRFGTEGNLEELGTIVTGLSRLVGTI
jgi:hypothetical protein